MRVALVFPRLHYRTGDPPLGVAYLAAALEKERPDLDVRVIDGTFLASKELLLSAVRQAEAEVVGVFADSLLSPTAREVGRAARAAGAATMVGGPAASVAPESFAADFDAVVIGEGEPLVADLVEGLLAGGPLEHIPNLVLSGPGGEIRATVRRALEPDLDALPYPAWHLLEMERYLRLWPYLDSVRIDATGTNVVGSRGCPWQCAFCQPTLSTMFGKGVRRRSTESVVAEVVELQERFGVDGVFFHDDTITANRSWVRDLCAKLEALPRPVLWGCNSRVDVLDTDTIDAMTGAGMRTVHLGIEAGSARVRDEILGKPIDLDHLEEILRHLRQRGASSLGFFMLGSPTETVEEMLETIRLARRLPLAEATFSLTSALPGTHLHERLSADASLSLLGGETADYYNRRNFEDPRGPGQAVLRLMQIAGLSAFYLHGERLPYVAGHLLSRRGRSKLAMKVFRFARPLLQGLGVVEPPE
jgi:anaerobic magnesium-protoporphyrin IX monomethyl ester cyclase